MGGQHGEWFYICHRNQQRAELHHGSINTGELYFPEEIHDHEWGDLQHIQQQRDDHRERHSFGADRQPGDCEQHMYQLCGQWRLHIAGIGERKRGDTSVQHGRWNYLEFIIANL